MARKMGVSVKAERCLCLAACCTSVAQTEGGSAGCGQGSRGSLYFSHGPCCMY